MGGLMPYIRLINRNNLRGDYGSELTDHFDARLTHLNCIRGDMRRFERDCRSEEMLHQCAQRTGLTTDQVKAVLDALLEAPYGDPDYTRA